MMKYVPEIFQAADIAPDTNTAINILKQYVATSPVAAKTMQFFLESLYHPAVQFDLPPGKPPYRAASDMYGYAPNNLFKTMPAVATFVKGHSKYIQNPLKREQYFIRLLETMHKQESELFLMCKEKKLEGYSRLNYDMFRTAYPTWFVNIPRPASEEVVKQPEAEVEVAAPFGFKADGTPRKRKGGDTTKAVAAALAAREKKKQAKAAGTD